MNTQLIEITRHELYSKVWSEPLVHLSKKYNLSDNGLKKICIRNNIPTPVVGYWAQRQHGFIGPRPTLKGDPFQVITIKVKTSVPLSPKKDTLKIEPIVVDFSLNNPHKYLVPMKKILSSNKKVNKYGRVYAGYSNSFYIDVSPEQAKRALSILDAILKRIENLGGIITLKKRSPPSYSYFQEPIEYLNINIRGEEFKINIQEPSKRLDKHPKTTPEEYVSDRFEFTPCGKLILKLDVRIEWRHEHDIITTFSDSPKKPLQEKLSAFFINIEKTITHNRRSQQLDKWKELEEKKQSKIGINLQKKREIEKAKLGDLMNQIEAWEKSEKIRAFIFRKIRYFLDNKKKLKSPKKLREWAALGLKYADSIDATKKNIL